MLKNCQFCKKEFNAATAKTKCCSHSCSSSMRWRGIPRTDKVKSCLHCECLFETTSRNKKYCSAACRNEHSSSKKLTFICECCGEEYFMYESVYIARGRIARFCGSECQASFLRKENSPAYKGGEYISETSGDVMMLVESKCAKDGLNNIYRAKKRIVAEECIGRKLDKSECVIHVDGNKLNNSSENLFICGIGLTRSIFRYKTQLLPIKGNLDVYK